MSGVWTVRFNKLARKKFTIFQMGIAIERRAYGYLRPTIQSKLTAFLDHIDYLRMNPTLVSDDTHDTFAAFPLLYSDIIGVRTLQYIDGNTVCLAYIHELSNGSTSFTDTIRMMNYEMLNGP